ncbi:hypothetical protein B0H13DRAFT_2344776 [Mycena leptocephala]|nr:hypothetical protein B0H13DRAFT_2344776 [Mycena leptocephala]
MGRRKKTGKASVNVSALPGTDSPTPSTPQIPLATQSPSSARVMLNAFDASDTSHKSYGVLTGATPSLSSGVAMSAAAPIPFRCLSKREEMGEDRDMVCAVHDAASSSATASLSSRPTPLEYNAVFPDSDTYSQPVVLSDLIPQYLVESELRIEADISRELDALHPRHLFSPRRSARLAAAATRPAITRKVMDLAVPPLALQRKRKVTPTDSVLHPPKQKRVAAAGATGPIWFRKDGELAIPNSGWSLDNLPSATASSTSTPDTSSGSTASSSTKQPNRRSRNCRGGQHLSKKQGKVNPKYIEHMRQRSMARMDIIKMDSFSVQYDTSHSASGLQGREPPPMARNAIIEAFKREPDARGLVPIVKYFFPVFYHKYINPRDERAMFLVDRNGLMFFFQSIRAAWLADCIDEFEEAIQVIVGRDDRDPKLQAFHAGSRRGPHLPIIFGHHRQSAKEPFLTAWHVKNQDRVDNFMALPIIKRIIGWVSNIMLLFFPGLCAGWRKKRVCTGSNLFSAISGISVSMPALRIGVCLMLIYVLKFAKEFNSRQRIWLVVWEAGAALELPAWVLAAYPSALFFHFNMDVHHVKWVTVDGNERPTPENSQPLEVGDSDGRGSLVFFNQATMQTLTETGHPTMKEWCANGGSGKVVMRTNARYTRKLTTQMFTLQS